MNHPNDAYDILIIGAGMGGLIAACELAQAGKKVIVIENLSFIGGRFSAFPVDGFEIPSGAIHTIPHGDNGPFAQAIRRIGVPIKISKTKVFASFHVRGQHILAKNSFDVFKVVTRSSDKDMLWRIGLHIRERPRYSGSFGDWMISLGATGEVRMIFDRFAQFALSTSVYHVPFEEYCGVIEMIAHYGLPGVPVGGARRIASKLGLVATQSGVIIRKNTQVKRLIASENKVCGVVVEDKRHGFTYPIAANTVISTIGPGNTVKMAKEAGLPLIESTFKIPVPAVGLKIQIASARSLIDHDSIMFCLDTQRIAGIVQATNVDPGLAPRGVHLLISHQTIPHGADWQKERDLALEDWRYLFGESFEQCRVVGISHFPERFPVNWASQGMDIRDQPFADYGLLIVGDGAKPPGVMMVEGVAASAEQVVAQILGRPDLSLWKPVWCEN